LAALVADDASMSDDSGDRYFKLINPAFVILDDQVRASMGADAPAAGGDAGHYPYARQVRTGWHRDAAGSWAYDGVDDHLWEVFCAECGDTDGPAEDQEPAVRQLRGPYGNKRHAEHAATRHFRKFESAGRSQEP
jgi:hypothetical protein